MSCKFCRNVIEEGRLSIGLTCCLKCASKGFGQQPKYRGAVIYGHKTAGEIQIMSQEAFKDFRRLNPIGRYSGRGSGIHVVSKTTSCR
jgi:hypothetical protein